MTASDLLHIAPLIVLAAGSLLGMIGIAARRNHIVTFTLTLLSLILSFLALRFTLLARGDLVAGVVRLDGYAIYFMGLLLAAGMAVTIMSHGYMNRCSIMPEEFYVLILIAALGGAVLVSSVHFASFFIGLELLSVSLYTLVAYCRSGPTDIEAGVKYFIPAATSSAFLLFGMALIYAQSGTMSLSGLARLTETSDEGLPLPVLLGAGLMLTAIGFKLALVPFHLWAADVYEGSPAPATAFIATASKGAAFALLFRTFGALRIQASEAFFLVLMAVAILTMFVGSFLALRQNHLKRLLAYSSISHMGYLLVAFLAGGQKGETAAMFYLFAYFLAVLGAFGVIAALSGEMRDCGAIDDCRGLAWRRPLVGTVLALMMFSLAGIPLTAGFLGKLYILLVGAQSRLWPAVFALVISSILGLFYYLRVVVVIYEPASDASHDAADDRPRQPVRSPLTEALLALLAVLLIAVGAYPAPVVHLIDSLRSTLR